MILGPRPEPQSSRMLSGLCRQAPRTRCFDTAVLGLEQLGGLEYGDSRAPPPKLRIQQDRGRAWDCALPPALALHRDSDLARGSTGISTLRMRKRRLREVEMCSGAHSHHAEEPGCEHGSFSHPGCPFSYTLGPPNPGWVCSGCSLQARDWRTRFPPPQSPLWSPPSEVA